MNNEISNTTLFVNIRNLLEGNRKKIKKTVNQVMVATYWDMGRLIVEDEQQGKGRAEYGKKLLQVLSEQLTIEFGKGFDVTNLRRMRAFYVIYPIRDTLCLELSWSHYRHLIRIDKTTC